MNNQILIFGFAVWMISGSNSKLRKIKNKFEPRIVGGKDALPHAYPYMAALYVVKGNSHFFICGGTILTPQYVLTASHCVIDHKRDPLVVCGGVHNIKKRATEKWQVKKIKKIIPHKDKEKDICLLKLAEPFLFDKAVSFVLLPREGYYPKAGTLCKTLGWGRTTKFPPSKGSDPKMASVLQVVEIPVLSITKCRQLYKNIPIWDWNLCAIGNGKGACTGDSGGPLICTDDNHLTVVAGVDYGGVEGVCGNESYPEIYTNTGSFVNWINNH